MPETPSPAARLGEQRLTLSDVVEVARDARAIAPLSSDVVAQMEGSAGWVARVVDDIVAAKASGRKPDAYYGINTGFGALAGRTALDSAYLIKALGRNLVASHAVGVGPWFDEPVVRAAMLIRAQSLAQGRSGVRPLIVETLRNMLNAGVYPAVPEQGSLGASGDLAPLAHLALVMCGVPHASADEDLALDPTDGEAFVPHDDAADGEQRLWRRVPGAEAMQRIGGKIELQAKEALALTNGATFSAALAALALHDALHLLDHAPLIVALTLEGMRGFRDPFLSHLHRARGHAAAERFGEQVLAYVAGSELLDPGDAHIDPERMPPQDPYSVRCAPQVHGTIADTLALARTWVEMEINAATDNPLIFLELPRRYKTLSGGNFHGEPIAMAMDFLAIAITELASISDRRMFMLTDWHPDKPHGLPAFLLDEPGDRKGLNSGMMLLQVAAASLVSDCKTLAHPDSVDSIPSSANQEDHVSMSLNAARHARDVVRNVEQVLAMELLCASQAIALQLAKPGNGGLRLGAGTRVGYDAVRAAGIAPLMQDRVLYPDIRKAVALIRSRRLIGH
jgi:histidine ammonia-lyase